jgi:hypothetical protein
MRRGIASIPGVSVGLFVCLMLLNPTSAFAETPEITRTLFVDDSGVFANCGSFNILANYSGSLQTTVFFNQDGIPIRATVHGRARGTLTNSVTGYSLSDAPSVLNRTVDLLKETQTDVGTTFNITVPGVGAVLIEAGRIVFQGNNPPAFLAGPHRPPSEQVAILCQAMNR